MKMTSHGKTTFAYSFLWALIIDEVPSDIWKCRATSMNNNKCSGRPATTVPPPKYTVEKAVFLFWRNVPFFPFLSSFSDVKGNNWLLQANGTVPSRSYSSLVGLESFRGCCGSLCYDGET